MLVSVEIINQLRPFVVFIGLIGNVLSFLVFSRKKFSKNSISIYGRALAITDSFIVYIFVRDVTFYLFDIRLETESTTACKFIYFLRLSVSSSSAWILGVFSFDKMIFALAIQKCNLIKNKKFQYGSLVAIIAFHSLLYSALSIPIELESVSLDSNNNNNNASTSVGLVNCHLKSVPFLKVINVIYLVEGNFLPLCLMLVCTVVIIRCLVKSRQNLEKIVNKEMKKRRAKEAKFAVNSIILNVLFAILVMPLSLLYLIPIDDVETYKLIFKICILSFYLNYSIGFFTYLVSNSIFRQELADMLRFGRKRKGFVSQYMTLRQRAVVKQRLRSKSI
jgi:hypothetical protein